jgi:hypothetical protein
MISSSGAYSGIAIALGRSLMLFAFLLVIWMLRACFFKSRHAQVML